MPLGAGSPTNPTTTLLPWQSAGPAFWSAAAGEGGAGRASLPCPCHSMLHKWQGQLSQAHTLWKPHKHGQLCCAAQATCMPPAPTTLCPTLTSLSARDSEGQGQLAYFHDLGPALLPTIGDISPSPTPPHSIQSSEASSPKLTPSEMAHPQLLQPDQLYCASLERFGALSGVLKLAWGGAGSSAVMGKAFS